jgi:hypothetical protein
VLEEEVAEHVLLLGDVGAVLVEPAAAADHLVTAARALLEVAPQVVVPQARGAAVSAAAGVVADVAAVALVDLLERKGGAVAVEDLHGAAHAIGHLLGAEVAGSHEEIMRKGGDNEGEVRHGTPRDLAIWCRCPG